MPDAFAGFLRFLAPLFCAENRAGADAVAAAFLGAADQSPTAPATDSPMSDTLCQDVLRHAPLSGLARFAPVLANLNWHYSGLDDGRIRPDIARRMFTAELIGPDGYIHHPDLRAGVFLQRSAVDYVTRSHAAEECFHMLAGEAYWSTNDDTPKPLGAGAAIFHPSNTPHRSETRAQPMLAAWRWSDDIGWDSYQLKD